MVRGCIGRSHGGHCARQLSCRGCFGHAMLALAQEKWRRLKDKWEADFPLYPGMPRLGSWLEARSSPWGIGCRACHAAQDKGPYGRYDVTAAGSLQAVNFRKHAGQKKHKAAVKSMLAGVTGAEATGDFCGGAPDASEFEEVLNSAAQPLGAGKKRAHLTWCLAEAMKASDQERLQNAVAVALFRDERKGLISIRFRSVSRDLAVHSGTLGCARDPGTGAASITKATLEVMQRACSRFANAPPECKQKPRLLQALYTHFRESVVAIAVDAAADEVTSAELMRSSWDGPALTPNLRFVLRDKAHGSRRITSRPWKCDAFLEETLDYFCFGRCAIAKLLQFSPEIRRIFASECAQDQQSFGRVKNFRAAKHRFESHARPLGRSVLHLHSCLRTALHVMHAGNDAPAKKCKEWLLWLTEERCLQAAMLADAADCSLCLTRAMDSEALDPAALSHDVGVYLKTIGGLFVESRCLHSFGYTTCMLETLQTPVVFQVGAKTCSLGTAEGVGEATKDRCLERMRAWVALARAAVEAEFPSFELAQSYRVFRLAGAPEAPDQKDLERIAKACRLDLALLSAQFEHCYPHAAMEYRAEAHKLVGKSTREDNKLAWRRALEKLEGGRGPSLDVLRAALAQYFVFCPSSSGVEQAFSKGDWAFSSRRQRMKPSTEEVCRKVLLDKDSYAVPALVQKAQLVWSLCLGPPRVLKAPRRDKGIKRPWQQSMFAEAEFLRQRRAADAAVAQAGCIAGELQSASWSAAHDKELGFQSKKPTRGKRKLSQRVACWIQKPLLT